MIPDTCRSCQARIFWAVSAKTGKRMPIDFEPSAKGNLRIGPGPVATVIGGGAKMAMQARGQAYISHFSTCPQSKEWRSKNRKEVVS